MKSSKRAYCRFYQWLMRMAVPFMPYRKPRVLDSLDKVPELLSNKRVDSVLLVTDSGIRELGLTKNLETMIKKEGIKLSVFDNVVPNPTIENIEKGLVKYNSNNCTAIIAFGGGSVMDCAKIIGARAVKPKQKVNEMKGLLKIHKKLPLLIAVPTTAGTGSETTVAAVITDEKTHFKYAINDFCLIPYYAVLDYRVTLGLPPFVTATTGMDALTHAVEAYIGKSTTSDTRKMSEDAVLLIVDNLKKAFDNGQDVEARKNMLMASFEAGAAFTKSYVGYVHAVAHSLGGKYGVAHGLANAVILPYFLKEYGSTCEVKLSKLAKMARIATYEDSHEVSAQKFIKWIESMNKYFGLPKTLDMIKLEDIDDLATKADKEGNPLYPVPKLMDKEELKQMYIKIGGLETKAKKQSQKATKDTKKHAPKTTTPNQKKTAKEQKTTK